MVLVQYKSFYCVCIRFIEEKTDSVLRQSPCQHLNTITFPARGCCSFLIGLGRARRAALSVQAKNSNPL